MKSISESRLAFPRSLRQRFRLTGGPSASRAARLVGVLACALLASCGSLIYERDWRSFESAAGGDELVARWRGSWASDANGHSGGLRCMTTREADGGMLARFMSTYGWFFSFGHRAHFEVTALPDGSTRFEGSEDLGFALGGVYRYEGTIRDRAFQAHYESERGDHGTFLMERVD